MSAPPSPLNKRTFGVGKRPLRQSLYEPNTDHYLPFYLTKDYGGCDFILFVESTSGKPTMSSFSSSTKTTSANASGHQTSSHANSLSTGGSANAATGASSGCSVGGSGTNVGAPGGGPIIIHLIAPNLQEKAAWMSDISQVSFNLSFFSRTRWWCLVS